MPSEKEYQRAVKIIEESLLIDTGQKVRSIEARDPFGNITRLYDRKKGEIIGTLQTEKGENSNALENAIETINQSGEVDVVRADDNPMPIVAMIIWFATGIFTGLLIAGAILQFTD